MSRRVFGIDVGGTKIAIVFAIEQDGEIEFIDKVKFPTTTVDETINSIFRNLEDLMKSRVPYYSTRCFTN